MSTHYTAHLDTTTGARTLHRAVTVPARPTHAAALAHGGDALHAAHVALGMIDAPVAGRTGTDALNAGVDGIHYRSSDRQVMPHKVSATARGRNARLAERDANGDVIARPVAVSRLADITPRDDDHAAALIDGMLRAQARLLARG